MIILKDIVKIYPGTGNKKALDDVTLEIKEGEFFTLVGPSGCGKSTILKIIAKIENPTFGTVDSPDNIGMVFQLGALFPWMTVRQNVMFGLKMAGEKDRKAEETAGIYIEMVGLRGFENKYPRELSGGQRQRVGIARALAINPQALLLDEPFSALDPLTCDELYRDLLEIWKKTGKTIVMVSHLLEEAVFLADRIAVLNAGRIKGVVTIGFKRPRKERKEEFMNEVEKIKDMMRENLDNQK